LEHRHRPPSAGGKAQNASKQSKYRARQSALTVDDPAGGLGDDEAPGGILKTADAPGNAPARAVTADEGAATGVVPLRAVTVPPPRAETAARALVVPDVVAVDAATGAARDATVPARVLETEPRVTVSAANAPDTINTANIENIIFLTIVPLYQKIQF
jgi:hypothetical protein